MGFGEAVGAFWGRYFDFQGRSRRSEYWWSYLFLVIVTLVLYVLVGVSASSDSSGGLAMLGFVALAIFYLAALIPSLAIGVRRLHDQDKTGWWMLIAFIPFGGLVLIIFFCMDGTSGPNKYGPDPKGRPDMEAFA